MSGPVTPWLATQHAGATHAPTSPRPASPRSAPALVGCSRAGDSSPMLPGLLGPARVQRQGGPMNQRFPTEKGQGMTLPLEGHILENHSWREVPLASQGCRRQLPMPGTAPQSTGPQMPAALLLKTVLKTRVSFTSRFYDFSLKIRLKFLQILSRFQRGIWGLIYRIRCLRRKPFYDT